MKKIVLYSLGTAAQLALAFVVLLTPGMSRADVDCSSIAACVVPHDVPPPRYYQPAFQVNLTGQYHVELDVFSDGGCQTFYDTASADGSFFGLTTFEYGLRMSPGDVISVKIRVADCPETDCLQIVASDDSICPGL